MRLQSNLKGSLNVAGHLIMPGLNEVSDEDFYALMNYKTFAHRVRKLTLQAMDGFPLEKADKVEEPKAVEKESSESDDEHVETKKSAKKALKDIEETEDKELLNAYLQDSRSNISSAAAKKLETLG